MTSKKKFLKELESRLEENAKLSQGGLPESTRWLGSLIGLYPWQSLLFSSGVLALLVLLGFPTQMVRSIEKLLLIF